MNNLLSLFFVILIVGAAGIVAQPPPPPLIYNAPDKSVLREFVSDDKTFQITFPGVAEVTKNESPDGNVLTHRVYRKGSNSIVNVLDYEVDLSDKEKIYEAIKSSLLKNRDSTIQAEKGIKIGGLDARQFDVLRGSTFQKVALLIVGKRLYEIKTDVTNWQILSDYEKDKVVDFETETARFFASFRLINPVDEVTKPAESSPATSNEDVRGVSTGSSYKNAFFNFSLSFPDDWTQLENTEIEANRNTGINALKTENKKGDKAFEKAARREELIFAVSQRNEKPEKGANFVIGATVQPNKNLDSKTLAVVSKNFLVTNPNIKLVKDVTKVRINGTEFSTFALQVRILNGTVKQKIYITMQKGYSLTFGLSYLNLEGEEALDKIMESLKFEAKSVKSVKSVKSK